MTLNTLFEDNQGEFQIFCPDLAMLVLQVTLGANLIGWYSVPVRCIRQGYRTIPMLDSNLEIIKQCFLLTYVTLTKFE